ncbi:MarR family transcriptional regulator [Paenibacillus profundus]|uniref:MarR family transcriptional regulator n=1 Tax=Paenibacillus profundus TaxID=1173085 RepID=A0ABS8YRY3_9BACL|nr:MULTISPECIES: MarR family transcriptional regulator [Paenibacillus]MCE5173380.1 MarR family transcriptional regulator [Paenibacillus profundus]
MGYPEPNKQFIFGLYWKFAHLREQYESREITVFLEKALASGVTDCPKNITSIHVIDCIGKNEPVNNTAIAEKMELSKASITKISTKLYEDGFVKRTRLNDNKKEIYFRLTSKGKKLYELHDKLHKLEEERFYRFLDKYSSTELDFVRQFMQDAVGEMEQKLTT